MLETLIVENLGVLERVEVALGPGVVAVTGETGAGKTLLVSALALLLGDRAAPELLGAADGPATVVAEFSLPEGEVLVARREIGQGGRSRARINGEPTTVAQLSEAVASQVQLFGQHLALRLATPGAQAEVLDRFGGVRTETLRALEHSVRVIERRLDELASGASDLGARVELVRHELEVIEAAQLADASEDARLLEELEVLGRVQEQRGALERVHDVLTRDAGVLEQLASLAHGLPGGGSRVASGLLEAMELLEETAKDARAELDVLEEDPARTAWIEERLELLARLKRRFGATLAEVLRRHQELAEELARLSAAVDEEEGLRRELGEARSALAGERAVVAAARRQAGEALAREVRALLGALALDRAVFDVQLEGPHGLDPVFVFSANPGFVPVPLGKAASGGELSRLMLAVASVVGGEAPSLVLDEVDAGIGGRTGARLAELLHAMARDRQILVVTHLPQIAAAATQHLVVEKTLDGDRTRTLVRQVTGEERVREIARMLSGHPDSETAVVHARELIARFGT
jgi:DNA repair protein RecN (Recombination protein N)